MTDITGLIDPHIHAAPEHIPRLLDDISLARQALEAGMAGIMIKSHTTLTADRATIAGSVVPGILVFSLNLSKRGNKKNCLFGAMMATFGDTQSKASPSMYYPKFKACVASGSKRRMSATTSSAPVLS